MVPKPNPGKSGDDKNKHGIHECNSFNAQQLHHATHAYVHALVGFLI